jgi:lipid-A-disaccharide synthase
MSDEPNIAGQDAPSAAPAPRAVIDLSKPSRELKLFLVAGEHSGDALGASLMDEIGRQHGKRVRYLGVGGPKMEARGLTSQFPLSDVAVMGPLAILGRLPLLVKRVRQTAAAAVAAEPDAVVIIDSPEFTHPIARRIRRQRPDIPIIDYVSPSVWAWRPGRARRMRGYIDHVLALLPFEPEAHRRLGGPPCTYIGHPLVEKVAALRDIDPAPLAERLKISPLRPVLVVLPGSRRSEVDRLMKPFGGAIKELLLRDMLPQVILPVVEHVRDRVEDWLKIWPMTPHLVFGEEDKHRAFRLAHAALAASGTVTLELALAGTPMVVAYRVDTIAATFGFLIKTPHFAMSNLVLGQRAFPEIMQDDCTSQNLAAALIEILSDGPARAAQLTALARVPAVMDYGGVAPSATAARIVLEYANKARTMPRL